MLAFSGGWPFLECLSHPIWRCSLCEQGFPVSWESTNDEKRLSLNHDEARWPMAVESALTLGSFCMNHQEAVSKQCAHVNLQTVRQATVYYAVNHGEMTRLHHPQHFSGRWQPGQCWLAEEGSETQVFVRASPSQFFHSKLEVSVELVRLHQVFMNLPCKAYAVTGSLASFLE